MKLNLRIIKNDFMKSKGISIAITLFVACASLLITLVSILSVNLFSSLDILIKQAKTSHFMQMHSGSVDYVRLSAFCDNNDNIDEWQVVEFLGVGDADISLGGNILNDTVQDNGLCIQSPKFDFLLDLDGNIIKANDGEVYVPIFYKKDKNLKVGDKATIFNKDFIIAGFLRDSQMNAALASSKRFLVSDSEYTRLKDNGSLEYLIEFRLKDILKLGSFESEYVLAGLENNGPTITYNLFKTLNTFSDGIMIGVLFIISVIVVVVAFMCIRFTLLAKIEDDIREIGVMKAIGLPMKQIKKIYVLKYSVIAFIGAILGFAFSFAFKGPLLENIRQFMGLGQNSFLPILLGLLGIALVFFAVCGYVYFVLRRLNKISASEAMRFCAIQKKVKRAKASKEKTKNEAAFCRKTVFSLSKSKWIDTNLFLAVKDVLSRKSLFSTMLVIVVLSVFIMNVPQNIYNTISAKSFSTYMGIGECDMRIDIQQTENIQEKSDEIMKHIQADKNIRNQVVLNTKMFKIKTESASQNIKIELGNHSVFPVVYSKGNVPVKENEIALSAIYADEIGKKVGDEIIIEHDQEMRLKVCGIYSDVTNGGKSAKAIFQDTSHAIMWSVICVEFNAGIEINSSIEEYADKFGFAKVSLISEYINQTFGQTIKSVKDISYIGLAVAILLTVLITLLFIKMLIVKDRASIAMLKAIGFSNAKIKMQYIARSLIILILGVLLGTILAATLGQLLAGMIISSFGATSIKLIANPLYSFLIYPLIMLAAVISATYLATINTGKIAIAEHIKE